MTDANWNGKIGDTRKEEHNTGTIKGELEGVIVMTDKPSTISIVSRDHPSVEILRLLNFMGERYFPVRVQPVNNEGAGFTQAYEEYCLNEPLNIQIQGGIGTSFAFTVRFSPGA